MLNDCCLDPFEQIRIFCFDFLPIKVMGHVSSLKVSKHFSNFIFTSIYLKYTFIFLDYQKYILNVIERNYLQRLLRAMAIQYKLTAIFVSDLLMSLFKKLIVGIRLNHQNVNIECCLYYVKNLLFVLILFQIGPDLYNVFLVLSSLCSTLFRCR